MGKVWIGNRETALGVDITGYEQRNEVNRTATCVLPSGGSENAA